MTVWDYTSFQENQVVEFQIRQGFFRSAYIESIELSADPTPISKDLGTSNLAEAAGPLTPEKQQELIQILNWKPEAQLNGAATTYREEYYGRDRQRSKEALVNGQNHGLGYYWHLNGKIYAEIPWHNGQKHGQFTLFRDDGTRESDLSYKDGRPHGLLTWYDKNGNVQEQHIYRDGQVVWLKKEDLQKILSAKQ